MSVIQMQYYNGSSYSNLYSKSELYYFEGSYVGTEETQIIKLNSSKKINPYGFFIISLTKSNWPTYGFMACGSYLTGNNLIYSYDKTYPTQNMSFIEWCNARAVASGIQLVLGSNKMNEKDVTYYYGCLVTLANTAI